MWGVRKSRVRKLALVAAQVGLLVLALTAPAAKASGNGGVLVVGDSLEVLASPYLQRYLPGVPLTINTGGGYNSYQILDLFEQSYDPSHSVIVFDAGTNDNPAYPQILAENLTAVAGRIGDRCMVVPTIHGFTVNGIGNEGKNSVVRSFAASRPGTQVPDWAGTVAAHPELMQADGLHPVPAGAERRAQLIAQGIEGCLGFSHAPIMEAPIESGPELTVVDKFAQRQAVLARTIAASLGEAVAMQIAGRQPLLVTALGVIAADA
jgi:hypothetical protein